MCNVMMMTMTLIPIDDIDLVRSRLDAVLHHLDVLSLRLRNVEAANEDAADWVVLDNLRGLPETIGLLHLSLGRMLVTVEAIEVAASSAHIRGDRVKGHDDASSV